MDEYTFQELCCQIMDAEQHIRNADIYGVRGQSQYGIDIIARRVERGIEVGQAKCVQTFPRSKINQAANAFLAHWDSHWKDKEVKRFVLFVACCLTKTQQQDEINEWLVKFRELGIVFEAWSPRIIQSRLSAHPEIVSKYFEPSDYWVKKICGSELKSFIPQSKSTDIVIESQIRIINQYVTKDTEEVAQLYRQGKRETALSIINDIKNDSIRWTALDEKSKAKVLRFEANLILYDRDGISRVISLADEADSYHKPDGPSQLRTLIKWVEEGPEAAIRNLENYHGKDMVLLKTHILISLERVEEASALLKECQFEAEDLAESYRLQSLILLYQGEVDNAVERIDQSLAILANSKFAKHLKGVLLFYQSLSPVAWPQQILKFPEPIDWLMVKRDDSTVRRLKEAEEIFDDLLTNCETDVDEQNSWQIWKLACVACDSQRTIEAERNCRALLIKDEGNAMALGWGVTREFLDEHILATSRATLTRLINERHASIEQILTLCAIHLRTGEIEQASKILDQNRDQFEQEDALSLWAFWQVQVNGSEKDIEFIDPDEKRFDYARIVVLERKSESEFDVTELINKVDDALANRLSQRVLPDLLRLLLQHQQWKYVSEHAEQFCEVLATIDAVSMTVEACYHAGHWETLLKVTDKYKGCFPNNEYSLNVRRVILEAQKMMGQLPQAIQDSQRLTQITGDLQDYLGHASLLLHQGDIAGVAKTVQAIRIRAKGKIPTEQALHLSNILSIEYPSLAKSLLSDAIEQGVSSHEVGQAYYLALKLGIDDEFNSLTQQFFLGATGGTLPGIEAKSFDDLLALVQENRRRGEERQQKYQGCEVPIHMIANEANTSLAQFYHGDLELNEELETLAQATKLFIRHGGRGIITDLPESASEWQIYADITALLLSEHIGILDQVEQTFHPIKIAPEVTYALQAMAMQLNPSQPDRVAASTKVVDYYTHEKFTLIKTEQNKSSDLLRLIQTKNGAMLSWTRQLEETIQETDVIKINCAYLAEYLHQTGCISKTHFDTIKKKLGTEGQHPIGTHTLSKGNFLYIDGRVIEEITRAGMLEVVLDTFDVHISEASFGQIKDELALVNRRSELAQWTMSLRERICDGIENGVYQVLPVRQGTEDETPGLLEISSLLSLFSIPSSENGVIWSDDRYINSYTPIANHPFVSILDILIALRHYKTISSSDYVECLFQLRKANVQFIPIDKDEIIYHLSNAPATDHVIQETLELKILRQYSANCFLEESGLLSPVNDEEAPRKDGDVMFIVQHTQAITNSLIEIWNDESKRIREKRMASTWVIDNLFLERYPISPAWITSKEDELRYYSLLYGKMLVLLVSISREKDNDGKIPCSEYANWIYEHILQKRIDANPDLKLAICNVIDETLIDEYLSWDVTDLEIDLQDINIQATVKLELRRIIMCMPEPILETLLSWQKIEEKLKIEDEELQFRIGDYSFLSTELCEKFENVLNDEIEKISTYDNRLTFSLSLDTISQKGDITFQFINTEEALSFRLEIPENGVFLSKIEDRKSYLMARKRLFDLDEEEGKQCFEDIVSIEDPYDRLRSASRLLGDSYYYFCKQLRDKSEKRNRFSLSELTPPSAKTILKYLRIDEDCQFPDGLESAADRLISEYGIEEAIVRLSSLPCPIPKQIINTLGAMNPYVRMQILQALSNQIFTPLQLFHYIHIAFRYPEMKRTELSGLLKQFVTDPELILINASFIAILSLVKNTFSVVEETRHWQPTVLLAVSWAHAENLMRIFMATRIPLQQLFDYIKNNNQRFDISTYLNRFHVGLDIADPAQLNPTLFMMLGMGYALQNADTLGIDYDIGQTITNICLTTINDIPHPKPELLRDISLFSNDLHTFLPQNISDTIRKLNIQEGAEFYDANNIRDQLDIHLNPENNIPYQMRWRVVLLILPYSKVHAQSKGHLMRLIDSTDFMHYLKEQPEFALLALIFAAEVAIQYEDEALHVKVKNQFYAVSEYINEQYETEQEDLSLYMVNIALILSFYSRYEEQFSEDTTIIIKELTTRMPMSISTARNIVQMICFELPFTTAAPLWVLNNYLRHF